MIDTLAAVVLVFQGLIVHVDQFPNAGQTAVLPFEASHKAFLCIADSEFAVTPTEIGGFIEKPKQNDPDCPSQWKIHLKNAHMKFTKGITSTETFDSAAYDRAVPSLTAISGCSDPRDDIKRRKPVVDKLVGYVDYPGGTRTVVSYFPKLGDFGKNNHAWKDPQCYACKTQVTMETNGATVEVSILRDGDASPSILTLESTAELLVKNSFKGGNGHYEHHYNIFKTDCSTKDLLTEPGTPCTTTPLCEEAIEVAENNKPNWPEIDPDESVECGQTNYP